MNFPRRVGVKPRTSRRRRILALDSSSSSSLPLSSMSKDSAIVQRVVLLAAVIFVSCFLLYRAADSLPLLHPSVNSLGFLPRVFPFGDESSYLDSGEKKLENVLRNAAMKDGTVILTTLNEAWAAPGSVIDLFLESFRIGDGTRKLLNHLVIITLDPKAYMRCQAIHAHCYSLLSEGVDFHEEAYFMTPSYLKMMWRRIDFLRSVLELGYNFVFTDADVMWFRDPFPQFYDDVDIQIACDHFTGISDDVDNRPNGGFNYVMSNNRSIEFYKYWFSSREKYPGYHDQDVLNFIKLEPFIWDIGLQMRFLDTAYFGGLCEPSRDMNIVCTMHANCCLGMDSKLHDLKIMLQDWKDFMTLPPRLKSLSILSWRVPENCSLDSLRHRQSMEVSPSPAPQQGG